MDMNSIAQQFTDFYYNTFDTNRAQLGALYRDNSMLTFEGAPFQGTQNIVEKLTSLAFQKVIHKVGTRDVQPTGADASSLFVLVTGALIVDDDAEHPMNFSQAFTLAPDGAGSFYVYNDCFRLSFG
ncbi:Nuclear transport factor 2 [Tilletia horrida]|uniref:Nuclear transport factor 2 n=1 Tax=Tilletia horrida TaxID=155126 RepID=A0AAN6G9B8_9BASI|nr:Nuclear transport factor 2 [Tilletia horrida]KAK0527883.1 Nuclear transport factor 2 [Tilletia horrida]KAK0534270.1 Nuclear transport factor 2 [Tilletia horrida]KAK0558551.1 Nuclear transport factor 2 [Tilletia horrida]